MRIVYIFICLLTTSAVGYAQNISGKWTGVLSQQGVSFAMEIDVSTMNNGTLSGTSHFKSQTGEFVIIRFNGEVKDNVVALAEYEVASIPDSLTCALKTLIGSLRIDTANQEAIIEGRWNARKTYQNKVYLNSPPSSGEFRISRRVFIQQVTKAKTRTRPLDGYYEKTNIPQAKATKLPELREADVVFAHRIWRDFDLREKQNQVMASPKSRLIDILMDAVSHGELTAYDPVSTPDDPGGDQFSLPLTADKARNKLADSSLVNSFDKNGDKIGSKMVAGEINPDSILRFRIKEDFVFDKQRSVTEYRIIGIAPLIRLKIGNAGASDYQPAFWLYFPEVRKVLAKKPIVNHHNDANGLSYDDLFMKRMFTGYVVKEANDEDLRIKDKFNGLDRLYESDRVNKELMQWELNLWQY